ncbi:MAG: hypothetical protein P4L10_15145 [Acidobacteriaceae bacterium]|nr:hypothetical protein [Acidobacteriaceae bacterium]
MRRIVGKSSHGTSRARRPKPPFYMAVASHAEPTKNCKHPRVRVVSRDEDAEFVECEICGDVFDSEEFRDMEIEAKAASEEEE